MILHQRTINLRRYLRALLSSSIAAVFLCACGGGGGASSAPPATNPVPTIAAVSPTPLMAGAPGATVTITGSGFIQSSAGEWNQSSRATTFVTSTQLQLALTAADLGAGGTGQITVINPGPGGGTSAAATLTINNPTPMLAGVSPSSLTTLSAGTVLTLTGSGFVASSVVTWNSAVHTSTFVSATQLQITLTAADVAGVGSAQIAVVNPTPGGGSATPSPVPIGYPAPVISSLNPSNIPAGGQPMTLTINGIGFASSSVVQLNGAARPTTFVSGNVLTTTLGTADLANPATVQVTVTTGTPGGGVSGPMALTISSYPRPTIASLTPSSIPIGSLDTLIDVLGSGFTSASTVQVNGSTPISTNSSNAGELFFTLPATDLTALGTLSITVSNPGPLTSNALTISVVPDPIPVLTSISPAAAAMGGPEFALTLTGSGFVPTSVVQWNGSARPTIFNTSNQLTATIPASDIQSLGNDAVTVFTPAPGGGVSAPSTFTTFLSLANNDLIYDASRKLFWTSIPSSAGPLLGNSVVSIDPYTGLLGTPIWVGSEPNKLAISGDGSTLWVSFRGSPSARKVDLTNGTATAIDLYFPGGWGGNNYPTSLAVLPGAPSSVAVAPGTVLIYDNEVERPKIGATGATYLAFGASSSTLYGYSNGLSIFAVDSTGIASTNTPPNSGSNSNDLRYDNGRLYLTSGEVLDAASGSLLGTFAAAGPVASDSTLGRAFILNQSGAFGVFDQITAFNESTFVPVGSFRVGGVSQSGFNNPSSLVRWAEDGLAFRTDTQLYILRNALVHDLSATPADLAVSLTAPTSSAAGLNATVGITVKNIGPNPASGVSLTDSFSSGAAFGSVAPSQGTCGGSPVVHCNLGSLASGSTATVTLVLLPTSLGSLTNTATVSATQPDPNLSNNSANSVTAVTGSAYSTLPSLSSLSPQSVLAGAPVLTLTVNGSNFSSSSVVNWNNTGVPTAFVNPNQLNATVASSLLVNPGFADVTVSNPSPGGGTSGSLPFTITQSIALDTNDLVFDPFTRKIYASIPSTASQVVGNSIVSIDPLTGALGTPVPIGSEPTRLSLSDDGKYLYTVLSGSKGVRRMDLTTLTPGTQFPTLSTLFGPYTASDLAVMPGNPNVLATVGYSDGIQVWDVTNTGATARPLTKNFVNDVYEGSVLAWGDSTNLYSNDEGLSPSSFHRFVVGSTSFAETDSTYLDAVDGAITFAGGLIFADGGAVVDPSPVPPATPKLVGRFFGPGGGFHAVDTATNRIFFLSTNSYGVNSRIISAFDISRFTLAQTTELDGLGGDAFDLIRWGVDGLAFRTVKDFWGNGSSQVVLLHGSAVLPRSSTPNPVPSLATALPSNVTAPAGNTWLTITGSNFVPGSIAQWNGSPRTTVFVNAGQLRVAVPAADLATAKTVNIQVVNPAPGGGASSQLSFKVN
jgi:uncharacterized repeat protein (TIGR01451 family)